MRERIEEIIRHSNLTSSQFAELIGIQRSALSHILNGRNNPSLDVVMRIHQNFPDVDIDWLLTGKGVMSDKEDLKTFHPIQSDIFGESAEIATTPPNNFEYPKENGVETPKSEAQTAVKETIKYVEKDAAKIVEIKIFFDNGTYLTFTPQ